MAVESHGASGIWPCAQGAPRTSGHETLGHALLLQVTSHRHDAAQSMAPHPDTPLQSIAHGLAPQVMLWHADGAEQVMSQFLPWLQSMLPHAFALLHLIVQS